MKRRYLYVLWYGVPILLAATVVAFAVVACSGWCQAKGFAGSGMPPRDTGDRTCSCFDAQGREAARTTMDNVTPRR